MSATAEKLGEQLHLAVDEASSKPTQTITELIRKGANVNYSPTGGNAPLVKAVLYGNEPICRALLEANADMTVRLNGYTPLHLCIIEQRWHIFCLLLQRSVDVEVRTRQGNSALNLASAYGRYEMCELLIRYNADVNSVNVGGKTPYDNAGKTEDREARPDIQRLLLDAATSRTKKNDSPVGTSRKRKRLESTSSSDDSIEAWRDRAIVAETKLAMEVAGRKGAQTLIETLSARERTALDKSAKAERDAVLATEKARVAEERLASAQQDLERERKLVISERRRADDAVDKERVANTSLIGALREALVLERRNAKQSCANGVVVKQEQ